MPGGYQWPKDLISSALAIRYQMTAPVWIAASSRSLWRSVDVTYFTGEEEPPVGEDRLDLPASIRSSDRTDQTLAGCCAKGASASAARSLRCDGKR
jgi:hypothetical protein